MDSPRALPDYAGGSLVNLVATLMHACGAKPLHPTLEALPAATFDGATNIVFLIVDGLGDNYLRRRGAGSVLASKRRAAITSVFPSTTASAITTSYTGRTPLEHGLTGWFTYFGEAGCVGAPLPFISRGDHLPLQRRGVSAHQLFTAAPLFDSLSVASFIVSPRDIVDSHYNQRHCAAAKRLAYDTDEEMAVAVEAAVKSSPARKFVYAYWPHYDRVSHHFGSESAEALVQLEKIDAVFSDVLGRLAGTESLVVATADHGFVDVPPEASLELPAALAAKLRFPLCGERRVAYCHVHDADDFARRARDWLGDRADVRPSADLAAEGWLGPGTAHPRLAERIGDVALVMRGRWTVKDWTPGEKPFLHIGNHGGTTPDEMMIPLITTAS
ncbi:MAG TPA: alkaline phosphatase family protein [Burkholderiales bacterium]|nr:alkaline phosphatase family protein [Burkholderiales bacterium]